MRLVYRQHDCDEDGHKWRYIGTDADGRRHFYCPLCNTESE